ncbi:hypothetical protein [uncultured Algibacter sp.]|uniref:hypothetical protein n=1 Tax=uncultured Algibacter sp. TaxID=298659 RepID=UPI003216DCCD
MLVLLLTIISCGSQNNILKQEKPKDLKYFESFIWSKNTDSVIIINKNNLRRIYKNTETGKDVYFDFLRSYSIQLTAINPISKELSFSERAYIAAYVVEYLYKCREKLEKEDTYKDSDFVYRLLVPRYANRYNRELKANDYYGLKLLKKHHIEHYFQYPEEDTIPSIKRRSD